MAMITTIKSIMVGNRDFGNLASICRSSVKNEDEQDMRTLEGSTPSIPMGLLNSPFLNDMRIIYGKISKV